MRQFVAIVLYALLWPINIILVLIAFALSPVMALWSMAFGPIVPMPFRLFTTLNASLDGGIEQHVKGFYANATGVKLWWQRTRWTWRNPCNGWQALYGYTDYRDAFTFKRDIPLAFGYYLKLWLGWNNQYRGGAKYPYMFQAGIKKQE